MAPPNGDAKKKAAPEPAWDGPIVGDGVPDASGIGPATASPRSLLNRLPRQHAAPFPPVRGEEERGVGGSREGEGKGRVLVG
jgi:hypothetical protein